MGKKSKDFYTNSIGINSTLFEFSIDFGKETVYQSENGAIEKTLDKVARIRMSPQLAKVLSEILTEHINNFENELGPISQIRGEKNEN
ncbi:DUF3467 domain-containing protein [Acetobacterium wieringae]|uniref:DUF3467 domain-containing protein n=1 Tax=Acetobacterium wieringae TaxID=52694 RepID=A0ABY6HDN0_9FIRM|nr:DUF3467 domain-containing protein [Acetobacterium wieringae]UYO62415.1 DUF3467 domain-containing protein [Acetobacterium wieringae]VUZ26537.1 Uncharacterised protein [Acetobacterium wieringae]